MNIKVNGETKEVSPGLTLHQLLLDLEIDPGDCRRNQSRSDPDRGLPSQLTKK